MNPQCPICGNRLLLEAPKVFVFYGLDSQIWTTLLLVRHVIKKHPDWVELAD